MDEVLVIEDSDEYLQINHFPHIVIFVFPDLNVLFLFPRRPPQKTAGLVTGIAAKARHDHHTEAYQAAENILDINSEFTDVRSL